MYILPLVSGGNGQVYTYRLEGGKGRGMSQIGWLACQPTSLGIFSTKSLHGSLPKFMSHYQSTAMPIPMNQHLHPKPLVSTLPTPLLWMLAINILNPHSPTLIRTPCTRYCPPAIYWKAKPVLKISGLVVRN